MADIEQPDYTALTVQLLTAYVSNNTVSIDQVPGLIENTRAILAKRDDLPAVPEATPEDFTPAVSVRKSLASREHIVSMVDGKPYRTLKRHLSTHGLTPADYRARFGLAADYPIVAPSLFRGAPRNGEAARARSKAGPRGVASCGRSRPARDRGAASTNLRKTASTQVCDSRRRLTANAATASTKTLVAKNLEALGAGRLASLLIETPPATPGSSGGSVPLRS